MQLWGHRMFTSSWYRAARKDGRGGIASLKLYWAAMLQCPAGSLPNDEEELCMLADFGEDMRAWKRHRLVAMHGFVLCSDNRWYHPVVAEQVLDAYDRRLKSARTREVDRERLKRWRASHNGAQPPDKPNGETPHETRFETRPETGGETPDETSRATGQYQTRQERPPLGPPQSRGGRRGAPRNGFKALEQRLAAADASRGTTIEATAEEVAEIHEFSTRLRLVAGGSNG